MAYTQEQIESMFNTIINAISNDNKSLRAVLREDNMPTSETFYKWLERDEQKALQYARACEERADNIFEEILEIADDSSRDTITTEEGAEYLNTEFVQRSRLRIDARKWMLGKMQPKKYGDKVDITSGGEALTQPTIHVSLNDKQINLTTDD